MYDKKLLSTQLLIIKIGKNECIKKNENARLFRFSRGS
jgi:hypothetical protein